MLSIDDSESPKYDCEVRSAAAEPREDEAAMDGDAADRRQSESGG